MGLDRARESKAGRKQGVPPRSISLLGMRPRSEQRPKHLVCYRAGDETRGSDMEETREDEDLKTSCLCCWPTCFSGRLGWQILRASLLELEARITGRIGRRLEEKMCVTSWEWEHEGGGSHSKWSATETG